MQIRGVRTTFHGSRWDVTIPLLVRWTMIIRGKQDLVAGLLFMSIGVIAVLIGRDYPLGTLVRFGPGMLPMMVSVLMIAGGAAIALQSVVGGDSPIEPFAPWQILFCLGAVTFFGLAIERAGFVVATVGSIVIARIADPLEQSRYFEIGFLAIGTAIGGYLLFILFLGLPIRVWPGAF